MKYVYAVERGYYSDYTVDALFSTEELAQWFIDAIKEPIRDANGKETGKYQDDPRIVKRAIDPPPELTYNPDLKSYRVTMDWHGNCQQQPTRDGDVPTGIRLCGRNCEVIAGNVLASSPEHAIKIVNERRVQMLAEKDHAT